MSYEGREQHICKVGHRFDTHARTQFDEDTPLCPCGAPSAFCNMVDDTNGDAVGEIIDWSAFLVEPAESKTCDMGHVHIVKEAVYRVPTPEEQRLARTYRDYYDDGTLRLEHNDEKVR